MRLKSGERKETNSEEKKERKKWEEVGRRREKRKVDKHAERMSKGRVHCLIAPPYLILLSLLSRWVPVKLGAELGRVNLYTKPQIIYLSLILQMRNLRL